MGFNISNDPNYYENQRKRELQEQQKQQQINRKIVQETNIDLDIIQYKLDHKQYKSWYTQRHFWEKKTMVITIDIGYIKGNATLSTMPETYLKHNRLRQVYSSPIHLYNLVNVIMKKKPKWKVTCWDVTNIDYIDFSGPSDQAGRYGIRIECDPEDFY